MFYDEDWKELKKGYPLIAKKIEELRCEALNYEQYLDEKKTLQLEINVLKAQVAVLQNLFKAVVPETPALAAKP